MRGEPVVGEIWSLPSTKLVLIERRHVNDVFSCSYVTIDLIQQKAVIGKQEVSLRYDFLSRHCKLHIAKTIT